MVRDHGSRIRYQHEVLGVNARLDELQAAVLRVKLRYLDQWNAARQEHARFYTEQLRELKIGVPFVQPWGPHVYCYYVIQVQGRDHVRKVLEQEGESDRYPLSNPYSREDFHDFYFTSSFRL